MKYRLVEWVSKEHDTIKAPNVVVMEGPIEGALVVTIADRMMQRLVSLGPERLQAFVDRTRETIQEAGWEGEIMVCSDDLKFAKFEPVHPLEGEAERITGRDVEPMPPPHVPSAPPPEPEPKPKTWSEVAEDVPMLDQVWAEQSRSLQEMRNEIDRGIIRSILDEE